MKDLKNKHVWITGASSGIGKELSIQLAQKGAKIILTARSEDKLKQLKDELHGDEHWIHPMDLLNVDAIPSGVTEVLQTAGHIDILVNNAGISQRSLAKDTSIDIDRKIMEIDHFAVVALTKGLLSQFMTRRSGQIVNISSVAGKVGVPVRTAYCAAKHAMMGFMDALRAETASYNIEVMNVTPGYIQTNISINAVKGDGATHGKMDPLIANGVPVEVCARKIIRGMQRGTPELLVASGRSKLAPYLRRFFPKVLFKMMEKIAVQ